MTLVADLLGLGLILGVMVILDPMLSLATFVVLPIMFLITRIFSGQARSRFREVTAQSRQGLRESAREHQWCARRPILYARGSQLPPVSGHQP